MKQVWVIGLLLLALVTACGTTGQIPAGANKGGALAAIDPNEFLIGPGDQLEVNVWKKTELSRQVTVRPDGRITLPLLGDVPAAGLSTDKLRDELNKQFGRYMTSPEVTVIVTQVRSYQIFVQGQVVRPGSFQLTSRTTLVQAIGLAGGFTQFANTRSIVILRPVANGTQRFEVNYDHIVAGKTPDVPLRSGDTIIVQ